ncbi:flagella basal body P-ring formation protein FlgA [Alteraurantiacibacter palmitatis]|uniref:Flagella basal body P-ring formation protein FlgA n=1 Tax=Alteraurantiacibacter palmitatis TaxID=2054628 RepID=A0ABV7EAM8_9SPHN
MKPCLALLPALALAALPSALAAQAGGFADPGAIDAEIAAFTGAPAGSPGGARHPVDRRLRMAACPQPLALAWHGRRADMVRVECPAIAGWQIFVPVNSAPAAAAHAAARPAPVVERGQILTVAVEGRGFSVSQQAEALEAGAIGDWIRVRPDAQRAANGSARPATNREPIRARITHPGRAVIPVG